jgi:hypothetical protein
MPVYQGFPITALAGVFFPEGYVFYGQPMAAAGPTTIDMSGAPEVVQGFFATVGKNVRKLVGAPTFRWAEGLA